MYPFALLNDSTVRTLVLVAFRVLGGKGLSRKGHGKSEKYNQAYARKHKIYSSSAPRLIQNFSPLDRKLADKNLISLPAIFQIQSWDDDHVEKCRREKSS